MAKYGAFIFALILNACASGPKVHIFSLGVAPEEISMLADTLESQGYDAQPNSLPVPPTMVKNTLIVPAIVQDFATIEAIESAIVSTGFDEAFLVLESDSNHSYSTNNIGIYLVNPENDYVSPTTEYDPYALGVEESVPLAFNYFSECAKGSQAQSELNLYPAGVAILEEFIWDEVNGVEVSKLNDGQWQAGSTTVDVEIFDAGIIQFQIHQYEGSNWLGPYEAITLVNQQSTLDSESCDYTYLRYTQQY